MIKTYRHGETINEMMEREANPRKTMYLNEILLQYRKWKQASNDITSNTEEDLKKKIKLYADYRANIFLKKYRKKIHFCGIENFSKLLFLNLFIIFIKMLKLLKGKI